MEDQINGNAGPAPEPPSEFQLAQQDLHAAFIENLQATNGAIDAIAVNLMCITVIEGFQALTTMLHKANVIDEKVLQEMMAKRFREIAKMFRESARQPKIQLAGAVRKELRGH